LLVVRELKGVNMCEAIRTERWDEDETTELRAKLQEALRDAEAMRLANKQLLAALKRYVDKYGKLP
jgi:DNA-binding transcriptional regulator YhcF (GntR family)